MNSLENTDARSDELISGIEKLINTVQIKQQYI